MPYHHIPAYIVQHFLSIQPPGTLSSLVHKHEKRLGSGSNQKGSRDHETRPHVARSIMHDKGITTSITASFHHFIGFIIPTPS